MSKIIPITMNTFGINVNLDIFIFKFVSVADSIDLRLILLNELSSFHSIVFLYF